MKATPVCIDDKRRMVFLSRIDQRIDLVEREDWSTRSDKGISMHARKAWGGLTCCVMAADRSDPEEFGAALYQRHWVKQVRSSVAVIDGAWLHRTRRHADRPSPIACCA